MRVSPVTGKTKHVLNGPSWTIRITDPEYPELLARTPQAPTCLYGIGDHTILNGGLSVIGARKATPYGLGCARRFASFAASRGVVIVSGGAYGCDSEAHEATLEVQGRTVVVFGGGCDHLYPARNRRLFQDIIDSGGAVVSEHPWDVSPMPYMFRARNRIIAGLTKAVLIVEAGLPSGTFSTADDALKVGREVMVVPGPIVSSTSQGTNRLLRQGATPIVDDESLADELFSLFGVLKSTPNDGSGEAGIGPAGVVKESALLCALRASPMRLDDILSAGLFKGGATTALTHLMVELSRLEAAGSVKRYPDGRYGPSRV